jgi:hypothetical protein
LLGLEGEIFKIVKAIASTLDHFDLIVQTLQEDCVDRIIAVIQQTISIARHGLGKLLESLDAALFGGLDPITQETQGFSDDPCSPTSVSPYRDGAGHLSRGRP